MAKRPRPDDEPTNSIAEEDGMVNSVVGKERSEAYAGLTKEGVTVVTIPAIVDELKTERVAAAAEVAADLDLGEGSFWALLLRAGYTIC